MPLNGTILELLTAPNPVLDLRHQPTGPVTQSNHYEPLKKDHVLDWPDFTFENLKSAYGHVFEIGPLMSDAIQDLRGSPGEIEKEAHVDDVVVLWNWRVCRGPIKQGAQRIQADLGVEQCDMTMRHLGQPSKDPRTDAKAKAPDWCIFLRGTDDSDPSVDNRIVAVWGDSKCSSKWSSDEELLADRYKTNWIWPFRQVLTYCVCNATRYGYILTPEEVVVLRVHEDRSTPGFPWRVQHVPIPWENAGEGTLTVNLAIWALAMMSLNEGHRPIRNLGQTLPLDVWWEDPGQGESPTSSYEHHLSGRKATERPKGTIDARHRPTTIPEREEEVQHHGEGERRSKRLRR